MRYERDREGALHKVLKFVFSQTMLILDRTAVNRAQAEETAQLHHIMYENSIT